MTKVALVYDRVNKWGGAERVLLALHKMYPNAPLYTSVYDPKGAPWAKVFPNIKTSFLQNIPFARSNHEFFAPLMPIAFESFDFAEYDLVISVTSEAAKGIKTTGKTVHICYCLTPTRYLWSGYGDYFKGQAFKAIAKPIVAYLRRWDVKASKRPDVIVAISTEVQKRIKKYYNRDSKIIFPPVNVSMNRFIDSKGYKGKIKNSYLLVSRLDRGYKKVGLAIETFNKLGYPLAIVGSGRDESRLKSIAHKNIKFLGKVTDRKLRKIYLSSKALIMPQVEDFGIVAVEAQSFGVPVIAFRGGGALDTVVDKKTGIFFDKQNSESLAKAILRFEKMSFRVDNLRTNAKKFSQEKFRQNFAKLVTHATKRRKL